jgi:hypothetical protein
MSYEKTFGEIKKVEAEVRTARVAGVPLSADLRDELRA